MIYLDNAATTKPYKESLEIFNKINAERYFNPSASYSVGFDLYKDIENVKKDFISFLDGEENDKIVFTSGATESNNLAIFGSSFNKQKKYLFSMGEHPSVYNCACELKNKGYNVDFIPLQRNGEIDYAIFEQMCNEEVCFISVMFVNNETGAINNLQKISEIISQNTNNCVFHVDAVQGFGKINFSVSDCNINLCSISAHKIGGIKGVGALYISNKTRLKNVNFGGNQEYGLRSGTVNAAAIFSFYEAAKISLNNLKNNLLYVQDLKTYLIKNLETKLDNYVKVVSSLDSSPYITSLIFSGNRGETIMRYLSSKEIMISTGSACSSSKVGNRIIESMGYDKNKVMGAIRVSFSPLTTKEEIDKFISAILEYKEKINT